MSFLRTLQHAVIVFFLGITCAAFLLTMFRIKIPLLYPFIEYSYYMMAPYQGYERLNGELAAEGQDRKGEWHRLSLDPYFPVLLGERYIRTFMMIYMSPDMASAPSAAEPVARKLLMLEQAKGNDIQAVRLSWNQWEPSPNGFYVNRESPKSFSRPLATVHE